MKTNATIVMLVITSIFFLSTPSFAQKPQNAKSTCCDLKSDMRKLWEDHITWTRNVIFNILDDLPGTTEAVNRLLQNQVDLGNAIKPYYGEAAGNQLTALLREHILIAADLLTALKTNNTAAFNDANTRWYANADAIAAFLSNANPNWPLAEMKTMMREHLDATAAEAVARKNMNYAADVLAYDNVHTQILAMADMLTEGIINQFPNMFKGCGAGKKQGDEMHSTSARLHQNSPNPFFDHTTVSYFIPDNTRQANLVIYDQVGNAVKKFEIHNRGEGNLKISLPGVKSGIYLYSIMVDGRTADTKKMIRQ